MPMALPTSYSNAAIERIFVQSRGRQHYKQSPQWGRPRDAVLSSSSEDGEVHSQRSDALSSRVEFRTVRASPEEAHAACEQADTTLNFTSDRLTSIAKLSSVRSSVGGSSAEGPDTTDVRGLNLGAKRLASIARGAPTAVTSTSKRSSEGPIAKSPLGADTVPASARAMAGQGLGGAQAAARRSTLTPAETMIGVREGAADVIGQSVESLRAKLRSVAPDNAVGNPHEFDVTPHLSSLAAMSSQHVQQKRQEIAHAQDVLDKATDEIRLCQEQETADFDSQVSVLKGEFEQQMAQLEREFVMHAKRYAAQLQSAVEQCYEQHDRSLQRRTEILLYSLTHPPPPHPTEHGGTLHASASAAPLAADSRSAATSNSAATRGTGRLRDTGAVGPGSGGEQKFAVVSASQQGPSSRGSSLLSTISVASSSETGQSMGMLSQGATSQPTVGAASAGEQTGSESPLTPGARVEAWNTRRDGGSAYTRDRSLSRRSFGSLTNGNDDSRRSIPSALSETMSRGGMSGLNGGLKYAEPSSPRLRDDVELSHVESTVSEDSRPLPAKSASL